VDDLWEKLSAGGRKDRCGWLQDNLAFPGIVPTVLSKLLQDKDPERSKRVMQTMLQIDKLDIDRLKQA
jgi:predicted 3-demethylubiquinone-9 3-methyltransferase (glyoxalase superfamily)